MVVSFSIKDSRRGCCKVEIVNINVKGLFCFAPSQSNWRTFAWDNEKDVGKERHGAHAKDM